MLHIVRSRRAGIVLVLLGLAFFIIGLTRRRTDGSGTYMIIGMAFFILGLARMRRAATGPAA